MAQTGLTASWTTIRNALRTLPRITTAFARPASTPGPPGAYPQHGAPECRSGRDRSRDADHTSGPEPAQDDRLNPPTSRRTKILKIKVCSATTFFKVLNIITFLHKMLKMGQRRVSGQPLLPVPVPAGIGINEGHMS